VQKTYLPVGRQGASARSPTEVSGSASNPIDFVSAAGSVRVPQKLVS